MKISQYIHKQKSTNGSVLVANLLYGSIIDVADDYIGEFEKLLDKPDDIEDVKLRDILVRGGFLLDDEYNEIDYMKYNYSRHLYNRDELCLILMPTLACNFGCVYCKQREQEIYYDDEVIERIIKFVEKNIKHRKKVLIGWFGGEPLLCKKTMYDMTRRFKEICEKNEVEYASSLCTNGSLLDDNFIRDSEDLHINSVQITIDGPPEWHNQLRPFKDGSPSFDVLRDRVERLLELRENLTLSLRVNVSDDSYDHATEVLDLFSDKVRKHAILYFRYICSTESQNYKEFVKSKSDAGKNTDRYWALYKAATDKGWNVRPPEAEYMLTGRRFYYCDEADNIDHFYVAPDGGFYKCSESFYPLGREAIAKSGKQGNLKCIHTDYYLKFMTQSPFDRKCCLNCKLLPLCYGGCRLNRMKSGNDGCRIRINDRIIQNVVDFIYHQKRIKYRYQLGKRPYRVVNLVPRAEFYE